MQPVYKDQEQGTGVSPSSHGVQGTDFWDLGDQDGFTRNLAQDYEFSEIIQLEDPNADRNKKIGILAAVLFLLLGTYMGLEYMDTGKVPLVDDLVEMITGEESDPLASLPDPPSEDLGLEISGDEDIVEVSRAGGDVDIVSGNPYWALPNRIVGKKLPIGPAWTAGEEETFRAGLNHQFTWQRHKTVLDVRNRRLRGSEAILWDALSEKKFWTRMHAVIGLADFNVEVSLESVEVALGDAHSELVARFFKRFSDNSTAGTRFIMRQCIKLLDERGRLSVLKVLNRANDELRDLYMVAATKDPGRRIQRWLGHSLHRKPIRPAKFNELMAVVAGKAKADLSEVVEKAKVAKPENQEFDDFENGELGEVEFYDGDVEVEGNADYEFDY
jgi:hypothetical protein